MLELGRSDMIIYHMAGIYSVLNDEEKAYYWLNEYVKDDGWVGMEVSTIDYFIKFDPLFDKIREDEQFQRIVSQMTETREGYKQEVLDFMVRNEIVF